MTELRLFFNLGRLWADMPACRCASRGDWHFSWLVRPRLSLVALLAFLFSFATTTVRAGGVEPSKGSDGYYIITYYDNLVWFADQVNSGNNKICARLSANITLEALTTDGYWTPIGGMGSSGSIGRAFMGKFDGAGYTISGLKIRPYEQSGLFGRTDSAVIENIIFDVNVSTNTEVGPELADVDIPLPSTSHNVGNDIGVVAGQISATIIRNCHVRNASLNPSDLSNGTQWKRIGGIVGLAENSHVQNCSFSGYVTNNYLYTGGIVGLAWNSQVDSCWVDVSTTYGEVKVSGEQYVGGIVGMSYFRDKAAVAVGCEVHDDIQLEVFDGENVDSICGGVEFPFSDNAIQVFDGYYEIFLPEHLSQVATKINEGETTAKVRLMADIDMAEVNGFTPMGSKDKPFAGEFEGNGHTINNLTIASREYAGLFGYVKDGAIKNVTLASPKLDAANNDYQGFIVGFLTQNSGHSTPVGYVENCHVTNGNLTRGSSGTPDCVGGIVGKADMSAEIRDCSFQGVIKAHEDYVGGIVGTLDSGAKVLRCTTIANSTIVWGNNYIGGIAGYMTDKSTEMSGCFIDYDTGDGQIEIHAENDNYKGNLCGKDNSGTSGNTTKYVEGYVTYEVTGKKVSVNGKNVSETKITGVDTSGKGTYYACVDIGTSFDYFTTEITYMPYVETLYFWDNVSNIANTEACGWISMKIADGAFDSNFKSLKMYYHMFAGADHDVMLRPCDVYPAGEKMFTNCPNAKVYVDAEYYEDFCNDTVYGWSKYKDYLVPTTLMRTEDVNALYGARYAYDRNFDGAGSVVKVDNGSLKKSSQVHVIGADDSYINSNSGTLWIYQDIGETYDYNTTKIWASAFNGKSNIKTVKFQEITKSADSASQEFNISIGDSAFANNANLDRFEVALYSDMDDDHVELLNPSQIPIGKDVFAKSPQVKIYVGSNLLDDFKNDTVYGWSAYKNLIYAGDFGNKDFTEDGVIYSYYTSGDGQEQYTNANNAAMESLISSWISQYRNFAPRKVLVYDTDKTVRYVLATGVDATKINKKDGVLKIYSDIGESKHYKTLALSASGFQNQTCIKSIVFEDIVSNNYNTVADFSLVIPDHTFDGCSQLKELSMFYYVTKGTNHYVGIKPSQVYIGKGVFNNVHSDFRIRVLPEYYNDFITDPNWSQYKDLIVAADYLPTNESTIERDGVTYDYATKVMNGLSTNQLVSMKSSWVNYIIVAVEVATIVYSAYTVGLSPIIANNVHVFASYEPLFNLMWDISMPLTELVGENMVVTSTTAGIAGFIATLDAGFAVATNVYGAARDNYVVENWTPVNYVVNRTKKHFARPTTWTMNGQWVSTEQITNVPRMYVKDVTDQETVTLYNDVGTRNSDYQTVAVARNAFHNKTKLKKVEFKERYGSGSRSLASGLTIALPDSMFKGCTNLQTLDLVLWSSGAHSGNNCYKALTPDNFVPMGDIFAGVDTSTVKVHIRVGKEELQDFLDDEYWSKYASMFEAVDVAIKNKQTEWSCNYALAYDKNTLPLRHTVSTHDIDHVMIYGADETLYTKNEGLAALINDFGVWNNYKLDYVKAGAFKGNDQLRILDITDTHTNTSDVYTDFDVILQDSAFAHCKNFTDLNLLYQVTVGDNHTESMSPSQFMLGDGVFDDTPKLRIKFCLDQESAFLADTSWVKYKEKFAPCFFEPLDEEVGDLLLHDYRFLTKLNDGTNFEHVDATRATPEGLNNLIKNYDDKDEVRSFDEFRAFGICGLKTIYNGMFDGYSALQSIILPDSITSIETNAFKGCSLLATLTIPAKVTSIQENAFTGSGIKKFTVKNPVPAEIDAAKVFAGLDSTYIIYVPDSAVEKYKTKWSAVADHINGISQRQGLVVVKLDKPGTLAEKLGLDYVYTDNIFYNNHLYGNYAQYDSLRIIGPLDGRDIGVIRYMGGRDVDNNESTIGHLKYLDLYEADLKSEGGYTYNRAFLYRAGSLNAWWNNKIEKDNEVSKFMFWALDHLETLILPKSATRLEMGAVEYCTNLKTLVVGDNINYINEYVSLSTPNKIMLVMLSEKVPETDGYAFYPAKGFHTGPTTSVADRDLEEFEDDDSQFSLAVVPSSSLDDYSSTSAYTLGADSIVENFTDKEVVEAMKKKHVFTPLDLMNITDIRGFVSGNDSIVKFNELFYASATELGEGSLTDMSGLQEVTLPYGTVKITKDAFKGCSSLAKINATVLAVPELEEHALDDLPKDFVVLVPEGTENEFRTKWAEYKNHIQGFRSERSNVIDVTLTKPNTLADSLNAKITMDKDMVVAVGGSLGHIKALKVSGPIGGKDLALIRYLGGREPDWNEHVYTTNLEYLDLYDAELKADKYEFMLKGINRKIEEDNVVPKDMLWNCDNLKTVILPRTATKLEYEACYDMASLERLVIGDKTTDIEDDALGDNKKLTDIIFLCESKPTLDGDAFTDPTEGANRRVERMYVRKHLIDDYSQDNQYLEHTNQVTTGFNDIEQFRAFGCKAIASEDDLAGVVSVDGWFTQFTGLTNLSSLAKTNLNRLGKDGLSTLKNLQQVAFPSTLANIEANAFEKNTNLHWVDLSECDSLKSSLDTLAIGADVLVYLPSSFSADGQTNRVYGSAGNLQCDNFKLVTSHDYDVPKAFKASKVTLVRDFPNGKYRTITLPFSTGTIPAGFKAYALNTGKYENGTINFKATSSMKANIPYVVKATSDVKEFVVNEAVTIPVTPSINSSVGEQYYSLFGNLNTIAAKDANEYQMLAMSDNDYTWNIVSADAAALQPYTAYVQKRSSSVDVVTTDVKSVFSESQYHYYLGSNEYDIEGEGTNASPLFCNELNIVDGLDFKSDVEFRADNASYNRTMTSKWGTLCLPYSVDPASEANTCTFYTVNSVGAETISLTRIEEGTIAAGTPVIICKKDDSQTSVNIAAVQADVVKAPVSGDYLTGAFGVMTLNDGYFIAKDKFYSVAAYKAKDGSQGVKMAAYRAYVADNTSNAAALRIVEDGDDTTGITVTEAVDGLNSDTAEYYDLNGRRINELQKGVNIIKNGTKTMKVIIK